ncbi:unnamed protein product [Psylliodes chrysocephalus]|uniref:Uncharacterized protein n=1 Tax=Psylliodes chrysocephalus TaxID=3402493 RepID=A0A9P0GDN4_9CUCU|nr:unnamed protein product [Psylliodes chrysocephala]
MITTELTKNNKTLPISTAYSKIKIKDRVLPIEPLLIFQRISVFKHSEKDFKQFFTYELAPMPMSIYDEAGLRKNTKSTLYSLFNKHNDFNFSDCILVIDGGMLLHKVSSTTKKSFSYIMYACVTYLRATYGKNVIIVFDDYDKRTTKSSE